MGAQRGEEELSGGGNAADRSSELKTTRQRWEWENNAYGTRERTEPLRPTLKNRAHPSSYAPPRMQGNHQGMTEHHLPDQKVKARK